MANEYRKSYGFFATKVCFFFAKIFWCTPCNWGFWAHFRRTHYSWALSKRSSARSRRAMAVAPMFFFSQISWHVPIFQTCEANFLKPITDTDTMFPLKVAQVPGLHFRRKKTSKKNRLHGFFLKRSFEKTLFLTVFYVWSPISHNQDQIQGPWFRVIYKRFIGCIFAQKCVKIFFTLGFLGKKRDEKKCRKIFSHL